MENLDQRITALIQRRKRKKKDRKELKSLLLLREAELRAEIEKILYSD